MRKKHYILSFIFAFSFLFLAFDSYAQQLKLGNNPTQIEKSAVLQLDSKNQGLLLTKLSDTTAINNLNPPDGMLIYLMEEPNTGLYIRKNGGWRRSVQVFQTIHETGAIQFTRSNDTVTLNIPNASNDRGVVSTTPSGQTFHGDKIFQDSLISLSGFSSYSDAKMDDSLILKKLYRTKPGYLLSTNANGKVLLQTDPNTWIVGGNTIASGGANSLGTKSNTALPVFTDSIERMRITSDGKTGIATTTPTDTLDVNGSFKLGRNGGSFGRMGDTISKNITIGGFALIHVGDNYYNQLINFTVPKVKHGAMIIINPRKDLHAEITLSVLGIAKTDATVVYSRASNGNIEIALRVKETAPIAIIGTIPPIGLLGASLTTKFDVLYCNPK